MFFKETQFIYHLPRSFKIIITFPGISGVKYFLASGKRHPGEVIDPYLITEDRAHSLLALARVIGSKLESLKETEKCLTRNCAHENNSYTVYEYLSWSLPTRTNQRKYLLWNGKVAWYVLNMLNIFWPKMDFVLMSYVPNVGALYTICVITVNPTHLEPVD